MLPITEQTNNICWIHAIVYVTKSLAGRVEDADGFSYQCIIPGGSSVPQGTYHVSQRECHLLQRVQNLPAAWSCSLRSLVGAGDDFVSVPPTDHQELWTGNYYQNKNVGHNLLKINLVHRKQQCFMPGHAWKSSTQRQEKALIWHSMSLPRYWGRALRHMSNYITSIGGTNKNSIPWLPAGRLRKIIKHPWASAASTSEAGDTLTTWRQGPDTTGHFSRALIPICSSKMIKPLSWNKFHYSCPAD